MCVLAASLLLIQVLSLVLVLYIVVICRERSMSAYLQVIVCVITDTAVVSRSSRSKVVNS